jgi:hypothetical protein
MGSINEGAFVFAQLRIQEKGVIPLKGGLHDVLALSVE